MNTARTVIRVIGSRTFLSLSRTVVSKSGIRIVNCVERWTCSFLGRHVMFGLKDVWAGSGVYIVVWWDGIPP